MILFAADIERLSTSLYSTGEDVLVMLSYGTGFQTKFLGLDGQSIRHIASGDAHECLTWLTLSHVEQASVFYELTYTGKGVR